MRSLARTVGRRIAALVPERVITRRVRSIAMHLNTAQHLDALLLYSGRYEVSTLNLLRRLLRPGDTAVDVGANVGWLTLNMARMVGPSGRVISFEPSDWTFERLTANIALNSMHWIQPVRALVGNVQHDEVLATLPRGYRLDQQDTATQQCVKQVTLDAALQEVDRVDVIKVDTDGYEPSVFAGAATTLYRCRPVLIFEVAPSHARRAGQDLESMFAMLRELGYVCSDVHGRPVDPLLVASRVRVDKSDNLVAIPQSRLARVGSL